MRSIIVRGCYSLEDFTASGNFALLDEHRISLCLVRWSAWSKLYTRIASESEDASRFKCCVQLAPMSLIKPA